MDFMHLVKTSMLMHKFNATWHPVIRAPFTLNMIHKKPCIIRGARRPSRRGYVYHFNHHNSITVKYTLPGLWSKRQSVIIIDMSSF